MTRKYILKEIPSQKKLEQSFKKAHRTIERAQKFGSNTGKDKSLLHRVCKLSTWCNIHGPFKDKDGNQFVNPHTMDERIIMEQINPIKYVDYQDGIFFDKNNKPVAL